MKPWQPCQMRSFGDEGKSRKSSRDVILSAGTVRRRTGRVTGRTRSLKGSTCKVGASKLLTNPKVKEHLEKVNGRACVQNLAVNF